MDLRNGKRKTEDFLTKSKKRRLNLEKNVDKQLVEFGLQDEEKGQEEERSEIANKNIYTENNHNPSIANVNLHLDEHVEENPSILFNEEDANPVNEDDENESLNSNDVSSLNDSFQFNSNSNKDNDEFLNESFNSLGNPELQSTKLFPDFKSKEFVQLKENMPFKLIKTFVSAEDLETFFRIEFPLTRFRHNQLVNCSECSRNSGHEMRKKISKCNCNNPYCNI